MSEKEMLEMVESSGCDCEVSEVNDTPQSNELKELEESAAAEASNSILGAAEVAPKEAVGVFLVNKS